jgi:hypothetical protein
MPSSALKKAREHADQRAEQDRDHHRDQTHSERDAPAKHDLSHDVLSQLHRAHGMREAGCGEAVAGVQCAGVNAPEPWADHHEEE